jgi:hypothetical protein
MLLFLNPPAIYRKIPTRTTASHQTAQLPGKSGRQQTPKLWEHPHGS